jgi:2-polyprenyl-3-methyl-5-hydroxy-6-metoxy-1,4-benzoquinol methylase
MNKEEIYRSVKKAKVADKEKKILELCNNKTVLDVGCVGQDKAPDDPKWLHGKIISVAVKVVGVDIDSKGITYVKEKGISVYTEKEVHEKGDKFNTIVIADVIEHVNDPVMLLKNYAMLLENDGVMIITTPNATGSKNFTNLLISNFLSVNPEHTFWFCPKTILEVVNRAGLKYKGFFWLREYYSRNEVKKVIGKILYVINAIFSKLRRSFNPNFMILLNK